MLRKKTKGVNARMKRKMKGMCNGSVPFSI